MCYCDACLALLVRIAIVMIAIHWRALSLRPSEERPYEVLIRTYSRSSSKLGADESGHSFSKCFA